MVREVARFAAWMVVVTAALGCGSGVSETDAKLRCDQERTNNATGCISDAVYAQCLSCEEQCGDQCLREETCPASFTCPK